MSNPKTLLALLRSRTQVDCDTLDVAIAESLGSFVDCTSNQAIAFAELSQHRHKKLVLQAVSLAKDFSSKYTGLTTTALPVEIGMILLALQITPHLTGCSHIQTNPFFAYSTPDTIANAERIVSLVRQIAPAYDSRRICIKIPSTWEGLQACRVLEEKGIKTLATTLFTVEQAVLAGQVGCRYIAPYVNELRVHFDDYVDLAPNLQLCVQAQNYYGHHSMSTQVLPASLTSIKECMALAGAHHITIAPPLLRELAETPVGDDVAISFPSLFDHDTNTVLPQSVSEVNFLNDEAGFRMAVTRNRSGANELKLVQAINIFCDMQMKLEAMMLGHING